MSIVFKKHRLLWYLYYNENFDSLTYVPSLTRHILTYVLHNNTHHLKNKPIYRDLYD